MFPVGNEAHITGRPALRQRFFCGIISTALFFTESAFSPAF